MLGVARRKDTGFEEATLKGSYSTPMDYTANVKTKGTLFKVGYVQQTIFLFSSQLWNVETTL
jgi:hypothetical protein